MSAQVSIGRRNVRRKLAFVLGITDYKYGKRLKNAINDAKAIANMLKRIGFIVTVEYNLTHDQIEIALLQFKQSIQIGDIIVFYFSGHGIQWEDENFLIPKEANNSNSNIFEKILLPGNQSKGDLSCQDDIINLNKSMISVQKFVQDFSDQAPHVIVCLLDCCRVYYFRNPNLAKISAKNPFHDVTHHRTHSNAGVVYAFACAPGAQADDNVEGEYGLFTKHLLKEIPDPNSDLITAICAVTAGVVTESKSIQRPFHTFSLTAKEKIYLCDRVPDPPNDDTPPTTTVQNRPPIATTIGAMPAPVKIPASTILKSNEYQYLGRPPNDAKSIKAFEGASDMPVAASNNFLVGFTHTDISTIDRSLNMKKYPWKDKAIVDISFCSHEIGFILLTTDKVFKFSARNLSHAHLSNIQPYQGNDFSSCTSNGTSLFLCYKMSGTPVDVIRLSDGMLEKRWQSPQSCNIDEYVNRLRYSADSSIIGILIYSKPKLRFEVRNNNMEILQRVLIGETGCCGMAAMLRSMWLLSDGHNLFIVDSRGTVTRIEHNDTCGIYNSVGNVAVAPDGKIFVRSTRAIYIY